MRFLLVVGLLSYAALAAIAGPWLLRRATWLSTAPRTGIAVWLALAGSVVTSLMQAAVIAELPYLPRSLSLRILRYCLVQGLREQYSSVRGALGGAVAALLLAVIIGRILWCSWRTYAEARAGRLQHAEKLALVARPGPAPRTLVLEDDRPAVYCLPGLGWIVLTTGALRRLDPGQLDAVIGHEHAHLIGRHHVVVATGTVLTAAFPGVQLFAAAAEEITRLIEMVADDASSRRAGRVTLAHALFALASARVPGGAMGAAGTSAAQRIRRLIEPPQKATAAQRSALHAARVAVLAMGVSVLSVMPVAAMIIGCRCA
jgi:Zn-dependent protease with chaperone function